MSQQIEQVEKTPTAPPATTPLSTIGLHSGTGNSETRTGSLSAGLKSACRKLIASSLYTTGLLQVMQRASKKREWQPHPGSLLPRWHRVSQPKFAILCYHRIGTEGVPLFSVLPPEVFERQMRFLRKHYRIISLDQLCRELQDPQSVEQAVAITFDDGYRDLYSYAFPILQKYQIPATIFLVVGSIETGEVPWYDRVFAALQAASADTLDLSWDQPLRFSLRSRWARLQAACEIVSYLRTLPDRRRRELCDALEKRIAFSQAALKERMLTWEQVRTMQDGGISFGSHTMTHPIVSQLDPAKLEKELAESKRVLEDRLGSPVRDFAYPFGKLADCGPLAAEVLARCGYRSAVTTVAGINTPGTSLFELRRVQVGEDSSLATFGFELGRLFFRPGSDASRTGQPAHEDALLGAPQDPGQAAQMGTRDA